MNRERAIKIMARVWGGKGILSQGEADEMDRQCRECGGAGNSNNDDSAS